MGTKSIKVKAYMKTYPGFKCVTISVHVKHNSKH